MGRRRKISERGIQLREKQKARQIYGILERQFRQHFAEAERRPGVTGENLLRILELRLDNVVYRLGFADSRNQARQLVTHGHFVINGRMNNIPSTEIKAGDVIGVSENSRHLEYFKSLAKELSRKQVPTWLSLDEASLTGRVLAEPTRADIDSRINEQVIVEYYSR
jgi:small subunit ribosomal protein S4